MTLRETMALHATNPALLLRATAAWIPSGSRWRTSTPSDNGAPHEAEPAHRLDRPAHHRARSFTNIRELKRILATAHRDDFYHNLSEKLLTYALGRGTEYADTDTTRPTRRQRLKAADGRPSALRSAASSIPHPSNNAAARRLRPPLSRRFLPTPRRPPPHHGNASSRPTCPPPTHKIAAMNRRHFLRGLGACIALPSLASLVPSARAGGAGGHGSRHDGHRCASAHGFRLLPQRRYPSLVVARRPGSRIFVSVRRCSRSPRCGTSLQVVGGLDHANATRRGGWRWRPCARQRRVSRPACDSTRVRPMMRAGVSIDQVIANQVGHLTRFPLARVYLRSLTAAPAVATRATLAPTNTISRGARPRRRCRLSRIRG